MESSNVMPLFTSDSPPPHRYTYGKPVKGEATITAFPDIYSPVLQPVYQSPIRKIVKIEGKATVDFDIVNDLR
jgi:CD109 antigen